MRGLIFKCNRYSFADVAKSTKPSGIEKINSIFTNNEYADVILILLCIEKNDKENYINDAVKRISNLNKKYYKSKKFVVAPFVHLSKNIENPKKSLSLCKLFSGRLRNLGFEVSEVTFGTHKNSVLDFSGDPYNVSYFEF